MTEPTKATPEAETKTARPDLLDQILSQAETYQERAYAFKQMAEAKQRSIIGAAAVGLSATSWGKNLSDPARKAVARYALELGTDPMRHWEVLGGNLYDTAELWMDAAAAHPQYDGYEQTYINDDERLSDEERKAREGERARWNMPDAPAVCVVQVWRKDKTRPFVQANHAGAFDVIKAKTGKVGTHDDPVGGENPGKTAFTRAFRRAAKTAFPLWFASHALPNENGVDIKGLKDEVQGFIREERETAKRQQEEYGENGSVDLGSGVVMKAGGHGGGPIIKTPASDPYLLEDD